MKAILSLPTKFLCTDCGDIFKYPMHDYRCPMCGSGRIIEKPKEAENSVIA